ncbi:RdgB/HAM1 family non-canonical purine NTP pyrophosphatase [Pseudokineococcus sp. 5B2Z-1]|uniref:RdgB/HAM1 family non-canonical purine NTP pyrophosphatase n=1 Tax=Pseudokineococcus sp. 5B2Z-1 TaxID=3132744 RepID=UPI0030956EC0
MSPVRAVLATRNAHKVEEIAVLLAGPLPSLELLPLDGPGLPAVPDVVESGTTFAANALLKARAACAATGLPALADDSGLCVDVLGGAPGVFSARWAGRHGDDAANLALLLAQLADVPDAERGAAFVCAAALVLPGGGEVVHHGRLAGVLARAPRGAGGFGYDPAVVPEGETRTLGEMSAQEKNAVSHRARAFGALAQEMPALLG